LDKAENQIQFVMATVVPALMAAMLFSYLINDVLFLVLFIASIAAAALMILPARRMHRLHFETWAPNTLPVKLITSVVGMIYIAAVSVFVVSLLSMYEGFNPQHPATFLVEGGLLTTLIGVMAYSARNKERFLATEKRFFLDDPAAIQERLTSVLAEGGHRHEKKQLGNARHIHLPDCGVMISISPLDHRVTEVCLERLGQANDNVVQSVKAALSV